MGGGNSEDLYGLSLRLRPPGEGADRDGIGAPEGGSGEQHGRSLETGAKDISKVATGFTPRHLSRIIAGFHAPGGTATPALPVSVDQGACSSSGECSNEFHDHDSLGGVHERSSPGFVDG